MGKKNLGVTKIEMFLIGIAARKHLKKALKGGTLDVAKGIRVGSWLAKRLSRASRAEYKDVFTKHSNALEAVAQLIDSKEEKMAKFELGITVGEITGMLPTILSEAWAAYNDDKKISVDEGVDLVATILNQMGEAADDADVAEFFFAQAAALSALSPLLEEEPAPEPEPEPEPEEDPA